jgi:hypothetical protein
METKLFAMILGVVLVLATTASSPIGVAHAQAQTNTPRGTGICTAICTGPLASLTDSWWRLILSIDTPPQQNPFPPTSYTGDCSQLIQGNTLFLVGQVSSTGAPGHGTCTISSHTSVLFPLVNRIWIDCQSLNQNPTHVGACAVPVKHPALGQPFEGYRSIATNLDATDLVATLDGVSLKPVEVESPPGGFEVNLAANDPIFGLGVPTAPWHAVADGFWVLLPSLPIGTHHLTFGGCANIASPPATTPVIQCQTNTYTLVVR